MPPRPRRLLPWPRVERLRPRDPVPSPRTTSTGPRDSHGRHGVARMESLVTVRRPSGPIRSHERHVRSLRTGGPPSGVAPDSTGSSRTRALRILGATGALTVAGLVLAPSAGGVA